MHDIDTRVRNRICELYINHKQDKNNTKFVEQTSVNHSQRHLAESHSPTVNN